MSALTIAVRAVHYVSVIAILGELVFFLCMARPALRALPELLSEKQAALQRRWLRVSTWGLAVAFASGAAWLALEAAAMSGAPLARALEPETLGVVLGQTSFGRIWRVRAVLGVAIAAMLFISARLPRIRIMFTASYASLAASLLASIAWSGHAAADQGTARIIHISADALHLLAAGAWLGALPPLVFALRHAPRVSDRSLELVARITRRFSVFGMTSVAVLVLSGVVNAWYTVRTVPALFGTAYGQILLLKLALVAFMISLAAINRLRLTPRLLPADKQNATRALRQLRRNATAETVLGLAVVGLVGALGITAPALHAQPVWPFPFTLEWEIGAESGRPRLSVVAAHPTTYFRSSVAYATDSISRGRTLYVEHCAVCHGRYGQGDGPAATSLAIKPANLDEHVLHHREGDILWWIEHGIPGTPMLAFGERIARDDAWRLINFLRAQAEADEATSMNDSVDPWRPVTAPEFTFQIGRGNQETLTQQRGRIVLLVFYALPDSLSRLHALTEARAAFDRAGVRIIAVPSRESRDASPEIRGVDPSILATADSSVISTYAMFRRGAFSESTGSIPAHFEFLTDRQGHLRARWAPASERGWDRLSALMPQIETLQKEPSRSYAPRGHLH